MRNRTVTQISQDIALANIKKAKRLGQAQHSKAQRYNTSRRIEMLFLQGQTVRQISLHTGYSAARIRKYLNGKF